MSIIEKKKPLPLRLSHDAAVEFEVTDKLKPMKIGDKMFMCLPVEVDDEVYQAYLQDEWKERQRTLRKTRCMIPSPKTGKLIRCEGGKKCEECKWATSLDVNAWGGDLSYDGFVDENDYEPAAPTSLDEDALLLQDLCEYASKLNKYYGRILEMLAKEGLENKEIKERLGLSKTQTNKLIREAKAVAEAYLTM